MRARKTLLPLCLSLSLSLPVALLLCRSLSASLSAAASPSLSICHSLTPFQVVKRGCSQRQKWDYSQRQNWDEFCLWEGIPFGPFIVNSVLVPNINEYLRHQH
ncbi:hypothetical protein T484DRAFT_2919269 [Baffinella frigidus]|nr:hypothetical protein T484DRAFT_2919269 [Cryptophyta sp. CCMP2293]